MKKIINASENVVMEMCNGIANAHPELEFIQKYKIIKRKNINRNKVCLISGGGSGHEPAHAGFVGKGMLDVAVCGDVFASPSQVQVYQAIKAGAGDKGALLIIKNYSGDMMNFKNAAFLAGEDGIEVDYIKVDDDVAVKDSLYTVGRRGVAGTVFVHKIVGAAAEFGFELAEVKRIAEKVVQNVRSIGFAFTSCTVPAKGTPTFELGENEMEFGVGIHGEPGIQREEIQSADVLADRMLKFLIEDLELKDEEEVAVLVNGFGATPLHELYLFNNSVQRELSADKIKVVHTLVGNYMTSIDMAGASLSILKLDNELKELLQEPSETPAMTINKLTEQKSYQVIENVELVGTDLVYNFCEGDLDEYRAVKDNKITLKNMMYMIHCMGESIIKNEVMFCELDSHAGDGDFGMSVAKGFKQLRAEWADISSKHVKSIGDFLSECSLIIMEYCGGASGPIWGSAVRSAGKYAGDKTELSIEEFALMLNAVVEGIQATGERSFGRGADIGDKTLMDALIPCALVWSQCAKGCDLSIKEIFEKGVSAAEEGAEKTKEIVARMGRAGTVGERSIGYPDAGAYALGVIFKDVVSSLEFI
jgi:dihydroxyacetone kinase, DhaK subunit